MCTEYMYTTYTQYTFINMNGDLCKRDLQTNLVIFLKVLTMFLLIIHYYI